MTHKVAPATAKLSIKKQLPVPSQQLNHVTLSGTDISMLHLSSTLISLQTAVMKSSHNTTET